MINKQMSQASNFQMPYLLLRKLLNWGLSLLALLFLYMGIDDIVRVMREAEDPFEFNWLPSISVLFFGIFFFTSYLSRKYMTHDKKKGIILALASITLLIIMVIPASSPSSSLASQVFNTDSRWLRQAILAYNQFGLSGFLLPSIMGWFFMAER